MEITMSENESGKWVAMAVASFLVFVSVAALFFARHNDRGQAAVPADNWSWNDEWKPQAEAIPTPPVPERPQPQPEQKPLDLKPEVIPQEELGVEASTLAEGRRLAKELNRELLLYFGATWCPPCQVMKADVLPKPAVKEAMKQYVYVYLDVDNNREASREFGVSTIPHFVIEKKDGSRRSIGSSSEEAFVQWLNKK